MTMCLTVKLAWLCALPKVQVLGQGERGRDGQPDGYDSN